MIVVKRMLGAMFTLVAAVLFVAALRGGATQDLANSLDSPESSGRLLGRMMMVAVFAVIGLWLLINPNSKS